jgi:hypothetical protein
MRFQVPQFIEVEDKMVGPLTLKQFLYIAGFGGLAFIFYTLIPFAIISLPVGVLFVAFGLALAFYKPDGYRPFVAVLEQAFKYYINPKRYVWHKKEREVTKRETDVTEIKASDVIVPRLSESKLRDLSWSLDIHETLEKQEK